MRQDAGVQHIRVGNQDPGGAANGRPGRGWGIAIIGMHDRRALQIHHRGAQFGELIIGQRLGGEEIQRPCAGVSDQMLKHGQIVSQCLS